MRHQGHNLKIPYDHIREAKCSTTRSRSKSTVSKNRTANGMKQSNVNTTKRM